MNDFKEKLAQYRDDVNTALEKAIPANGEEAVDAMRYSVFAGGKRIRAALVLAFCELFGGNKEKALPFACAIEMIHTYSLIYDDLPCMDNDTLRRGKPTNHVVFGESTALMAGAGLYARAFETVAGSKALSDSQKLEGISVLLDASGINGIITGQMLDLKNRPGLSESEVMRIHKLKTSAMIEASALLGCIASDCGNAEKEKARKYAENIGLAFQIKDDILDVEGSVEELGKTVGKDKTEMKTTFVDILGVENSQKQVNSLSAAAKNEISEIRGSEFLCALSDYLAGRKS
ncbi:MAG: polyprenyl synthetase family protein [Clostridia bacterium]|nr:polyprenyl synthetase family protein [Clostridia bacterium]